MRFVQLVMGPAGVGKSTYCKTIQDHCAASKRIIHVANLDPAAEDFEYEASFDIRDLINVEEVMDELGYGPNGGLVYCMEYLLKHSEWLKDELDNFGEDEYVILDCPGQIELYSHLPLMHDIAILLKMWGFQVVGVYLLDALCAMETQKFISGCLLSLSCMLQLELPHINVVTKCDLVNKEELENILNSESTSVLCRINNSRSAMFPESANSSALPSTIFNGRYRKLTEAIGTVVDDFMMVSFAMMDPSDEQSLDEVLFHIDRAIQYGEDLEPKDVRDIDEAEEEEY